MRRINLTHGRGNGVDSACLMTATSMLIGKPEELDECSCVCPIIRAFVIKTNDSMPKQLLGDLYGPLIWEIPGTHTEDTGVIVQRAYKCVDWAVRAVLPLMFDAVGSPEQADTLRQLASVTSQNAANAATRAANAATRASARTSVRASARAAANAADAAACAADATDAADACTAAALSATLSALSATLSADSAAVDAVDAVDTVYAANAAAAAVWRECPNLIRRLASIGDTRPVERVLSEYQLASLLKSEAAG